MTDRPGNDAPSHHAAALAAGLQRLRSFKERPERDVSIGALIDAEARRLRQTQRATSGASAAWDKLLDGAHLPADLRARLRIISFRAGVLTIRAADAPAKYALDRYLRAGGQTALARLSPTPLRRVKITL